MLQVQTNSVLKSKKLQITILVVLGILGYHFISSRFIGKGQKTVKSEMHQIQQKGCDETIVGPQGSKYDPSINYGELVWQSYYESHKGEDFAEEMKKVMEYYDDEIYWDSEEGAKYKKMIDLSIPANNNIM
ncbi:uncharacterized protein OCT59_022152 [Rhizophagus irregularis]|uniref:Uncharacterized protein n=1 Tax=Rhizophagus irregularis (strain DAOM 197198w) TaxID=1432141 RepID=A0A015MYL8_RHIIW|nr:hypothetical protein RirG_074240 [Rhizophagus irregularis DAOM 197198w]UZO28635.1 hypothetical protein OCT59_022152 [Rhizophagus irregularis]GBC51915.2 hypothetical protein GLOIN_2v1534491 [Rhizophagus irregularis DAOM 181602=DAOM 197198]